eukprot:1548644-Alexandrium_andersonii.AAC.1
MPIGRRVSGRCSEHPASRSDVVASTSCRTDGSLGNWPECQPTKAKRPSPATAVAGYAQTVEPDQA